MRVAVFLSSAELAEPYVSAARDFARLLAQQGHVLVWGGTNVGLMRVIADTMVEEGGELCGVSVTFLERFIRPGVGDMVIASTLAERKALLLEKADAVVMLVGGTGTLDEATDIVEHRRHRLTDKPLVVLNTAGFYDGLQAQLVRMEREGFLDEPLAELVQFANEPSEALALIERSVASKS